MDDLEIKGKVLAWERAILAIDSQCDALTKIIGCSADNPLFDTIAMLQQNYTVTLSEMINDEECMLEWFWLENNMGNKCLQAGFKKDMRVIGNVDDLCKLMSEYRNA